MLICPLSPNHRKLNNDSSSILILPESKPINNTPNYYVRVNPHKTPIRLQIYFDHYKPRLGPLSKLMNWHRFPCAFDVCPKAKGQSNLITLELPTCKEVHNLSSHWPFHYTDYQQWVRSMVAQYNLQKISLGLSIEGFEYQALDNLRSASIHPNKPIFILTSGQHPIETTSQASMSSMADVLWRNNIPLVVMGYMNPDGAFRYYWRHNAQNLDTNRDWGIFSSIETKLYHKEFTRLHRKYGNQLHLFDFHNTGEDVILNSNIGNTVFFIKSFCQSLKQSLFFSIKSKLPQTINHRHTLRNYFSQFFNCPSLTIEIDEKHHFDHAKWMGEFMGLCIKKVY